MFSAELLFAIMNSNAIQDEGDMQPESTERISSWFFSQNLPQELDTVFTTTEDTNLGSTETSY